jgi:hypothetical protein
VAFFAVRVFAPRFAGFRAFAAPRFAPAFRAGFFAGFRAAFLADRFATLFFAVDLDPAFFAVFFFLAAGFFFAAGFFAAFFLAVAIAISFYELRKYNMALPLQLLLQLLTSHATHANYIPEFIFLLSQKLSPYRAASFYSMIVLIVLPPAHCTKTRERVAHAASSCFWQD